MDLTVALPTTSPAVGTPHHGVHEKLSRSPGRIAMLVFGLAIVGGIIYTGLQLGSDLAHTYYPTVWPYVLLGIALLIALGFEFVNGFHDTANAVATVIYTHSLEPHVAVVWSGMWNLIGVLLSSGAVAFAVVSLLPWS
jgi:inorganic phosphate transporter, PiT family